MNLGSVTETINGVLDKVQIPAMTLPPLLLKCTAIRRPGLSAYKIATQVIENNKVLGIPTEPYADGSENMINQYTYNLVKCLIDGIKNDAVVHLAIPMQSLMIQAEGGNAGGPVICTGTNLTDTIGKGIIQ